MFRPEDIAEYYNSTQIHYKQWWDLKKSRSLHYGIWGNGIKNFRQASEYTNKTLMDIAKIDNNEIILDAGCGVGGAAIFLCKQKSVNVTGITLSQSQIDFGREIIKNEGLVNSINLELMDYTNTSFNKESFDVVWACESVSSCQNKILFIQEAYRLLKPGGRLILSDCFLTDKNQSDPNNLIKKWGATWAVSELISSKDFTELLTETGFKNTETFNYTKEVTKSALRMYYASILATIPSETYKLINPKVSRFARNHYKCGIYQYRALKENLWQYEIIYSEKKSNNHN